MQWMVPERRLDEYQLEVLRNCGVLKGQNQWIQGFAGSGKSVLLMHAVQRIIASHSNSRVCIVVYTHALRQLLSSGLSERHKHIPVMTYHEFLYGHSSNAEPLDILVIDEVQDIPEQELRKLQARATRVIVAGDMDQSIYKHVGPQVDPLAILVPSVYKLTTIHRLTKRLIDIVRTILPGSTIEGARTGRMQEVQVTLAKADNFDQEAGWVWEQCRRYSKQGEPSAVLFPQHFGVQKFINSVARLERSPSFDFSRTGDKRGTDYNEVNERLREQGIALRFVGNGFGDLEESDIRPLTYVMTYHSSKGLDFNTVFLPGLNRDMTIWRDSEDIARRLFFVATTRSRRNLFMSHSSDSPHPYVQAMPQNLLHIEPCKPRSAPPAFDDDIPF